MKKLSLILFILVVSIAVDAQTYMVTVNWNYNNAKSPDLAKFVIYFSNVSGEFNDTFSVNVNDTSLRTYQVEVATGGVYFFIMRAFKPDNNYSDYSNEVSLDLSKPDPPNEVTVE